MDTEDEKVIWIAEILDNVTDSFPSLQPQRRVGSYDVIALLDLGQRNYNVERQMDHNWRTLVNFSFKHAQHICLFSVKTQKFAGVWILLISEQICWISEGLVYLLLAYSPIQIVNWWLIILKAAQEDFVWLTGEKNF